MSRGLWQLLLTCEHGGSRVPAAFREYFQGAQEALESHRGWDPGALELARLCKRELKAPLIESQVSRLLVELNRSPGHPQLFSVWSQALPAAEREAVLQKFYLPYRERVHRTIEERVRSGGKVLHLSVHSFTPVLNSEVRRAEIGLLYDPQREAERSFCGLWRSELLSRQPDWRVRRNYPYRGVADGLATALRKKFSASCYAGIELEVNQAWPLGDRKVWRGVQQVICDSIRETLAQFAD